MAARCALILLVGSVAVTRAVQREAPAAAQNAGNSASKGTSDAVRSTGADKMPDTKVGVAGPAVPGVGTSAPHTADPVVCGVLGSVIILNWILACCCAGVGAGVAVEEHEEGDDTKAEEAGGICAGMFACVECCASICSICALIYCFMTGLFRAWMGGQHVSGWCLMLVIVSVLQIFLCCCICCCASCGAAILGEEMHEKYVNQHSKHLLGSHMHSLVHKHKPTGTHPISEGHLPMHDHLHEHVPLVKHAAPTKPGKKGVQPYNTGKKGQAPAQQPSTETQNADC